ncbi:MAG TPA: hypothetical protein VFT84_05780 [Gemmatimonadales bacterium]|nr:hypothetical protein [Gemmatimonadales bacterium]
MATTTARPVAPSGTVPAVLARIHRHWLRQVARVLEPAIQPAASFWERWAAARFLCDQFEGRYRLECELMEDLVPILPPHEVIRLEAERETVERLRATLIAAGRRQLGGPLVSALSRVLLGQLRRWCGRLEAATAGMELDDLPPEARDKLTQLDIADDVAL